MGWAVNGQCWTWAWHGMGWLLVGHRLVCAWDWSCLRFFILERVLGWAWAGPGIFWEFSGLGMVFPWHGLARLVSGRYELCMRRAHHCLGSVRDVLCAV